MGYGSVEAVQFSGTDRRPEVIKEQKENRGSEVEQRVGVSNNSVVIAS